MSTINDIKCWPLKTKHPKILANGVFVIDGSFKIKYTLINGNKGPFVGLPGNYGKNKEGQEKWYSEVDCLSNETRVEMTGLILKEYNKVSGISLNQENHSGPSDQTSGENVPF